MKNPMLGRILVRMFLFLICLAALLPALIEGGKTLSASAPQAPSGAPVEMESYQLVLLRRGPEWTPERTPAIEQLQKEHLAHLTKMAESGRMVAAGPFADQDDQTLRGMCIYRTGSVAGARALAEGDPAVKAGRLKVEVLTWWVGKGYIAFPKAVGPAK